MPSVADIADDFVARARRGEKPSVSITRNRIEVFLGYLVREGISIAVDCLDAITDPDLREIIKTLFLTTAAGATVGATIGGVAFGPPGAGVGAAIGGVAGLAVGVIALTVRIEQRGERILVRAT